MFRHVLAGAGGWGDPLERDPAAVLRDIRNELLSPVKAEADYGVVVDLAAWTVDAAATARRSNSGSCHCTLGVSVQPRARRISSRRRAVAAASTVQAAVSTTTP